VTVTANDKMTGIPVMRPYNSGCRDAIHDDKRNRVCSRHAVSQLTSMSLRKVTYRLFVLNIVSELYRVLIVTKNNREIDCHSCLYRCYLLG